MRNLTKIHLWSALGPFWPPLGRSWRGPQERNKIEKPELGPPLGPPFWEGFWVMLALCCTTWRSGCAWEPHLVNLKIEACTSHAKLAQLEAKLGQLKPNLGQLGPT